ncbi:MAG: biotin/lipoyl-binding protein, partial [Flavobacteriales bacterium]|nr:biotin/lipoyl-binding protein [Flavobacteriales bacterium]
MNKKFKNIVLVAMVAIIWSCGGTEKDAQQGPGNLQVKGFKVTAQPFNSEVKTTATIMANEQVELKAPIAGQVLAIYFDEGAKVKKGQQLIR